MIDFTLSAFVTLLLVVDPVGLAPAFLAATGGMPDKTKRTIVLRAPLIAASILVVIALIGNWLLRQLGIGIPAFQIAGGLLLFGVSYQMIFGDLEGGDADPELAQQPVSDQRDHHQDRGRDQWRAQRDRAFGRVGHAPGGRDEGRREANRIDNQQQRHEGGQGEVEHGRRGPWTQERWRPG